MGNPEAQVESATDYDVKRCPLSAGEKRKGVGGQKILIWIT